MGGVFSIHSLNIQMNLRSFFQKFVIWRPNNEAQKNVHKAHHCINMLSRDAIVTPHCFQVKKS